MTILDSEARELTEICVSVLGVFLPEEVYLPNLEVYLYSELDVDVDI